MKVRISFLLIMVIIMNGIFAAGNAENAYRTYLETGEYIGLKDYWNEYWLTGTALSSSQLIGKSLPETVVKNFSSVTCENEMKADSILDRTATLRNGDPLRAALHFSGADKVLAFAQKNGILVRGHNLIWHSQTPRWFFAVDYSADPGAKLVDRETMIARMENYIRDEMEHFNTCFPHVIYAWDVVNEAIEPADGEADGYRKGSLWYQVIGPDYIDLAFTFARKYADEGQKLFYNDYNCYEMVKRNQIIKLIRRLKGKDLIDGMGMQTHIGVTSPSIMDLMDAIRLYSECGVTVHITEMDISSEDPSPSGQMLLAVRYRSVMNLLKRLKDKNGYPIESVTLWGVHDGQTWLTNASRTCYPLLFDHKLTPKSSFFGAILDDSIPKSAFEEDIRSALEVLNITD